MRRIRPRRAALVRQPGDVQVRQQSQRLQHRHPAGRGWPHAAHKPRPVRPANRLTLFRCIGGEVVGGQQARIGVGAHGRRDRHRQRPAMQRGRAIGGNRPQRLGERPVHQRLAGLQRGAIGVEEIRPRRRPRGQPRRIRGDHGGQARRHGKTLLGQPDGGGEQPLPRQLPIGTMHRFQHAQRTRHTDGPAAHTGHIKTHGLAVRSQEQVGPGRGRRGLAPVPGGHLPARRRVVQHHRPAAEAGRLRFHQRENGLRRDRRIHRRAAGAQHVEPSRQAGNNPQAEANEEQAGPQVHGAFYRRSHPVANDRRILETSAA